jgi:hypothetical protein
MKLYELTNDEALQAVKKKESNQRQLKQQNRKPFDASTTDMPLYDQMLKNPKQYEQSHGFAFNVEWMRPKDYIRKAADGFKSSPDNLKQTRTQTGKISKYVKKLQNGETFPMLVLQYTTDGHFTQEGLHRAFAALEVGYDKLPVMVVKEVE